MTLLDALLSWASVPYLIAIGVAVGFAMLQLTGLLGLIGGGDHDGDGDAGDHGGDAGDGDADADHDGGDGDDADGDHDGGFRIASDLGVGRVPMSLLWQTYAFAFGFAGLTANIARWSFGRALPTATLAWSAPAALAFGYLVTRTVSRLVGKVLANPAQDATSRAGLVGTTGVVISTKVDPAFGEVRIRDRSGHMVRVAAHVRDDEAAIPEQREVVVVDYDAARDRLYVVPLDAPPRERKR